MLKSLILHPLYGCTEDFTYSVHMYIVIRLLCTDVHSIFAFYWGGPHILVDQKALHSRSLNYGFLVRFWATW